MLEGIKVLDMGTVITAPLAGVMLADLGAEVIKVERPEGDPFRYARGGQYSPNFLAYNRGKRSIVLDLNVAADRDDLLDLVEQSDVLIENFRPRTLAKLGIVPEVLRARNARLIHCSITGFGVSGPYRERPAFDGVGQALSGISSLFVDPEDPKIVGPTITDNVTGMYACYAILGALYEREKTGRGRRLEVDMLSASLAFVQDAFINFLQAGLVGNPLTRVATSQSYAFRCSDGKLLAVHLSTREKFWESLLLAIGAEDLGTDPRFSNHLARVEAYSELNVELAKRFAARPRAEWMAQLERHDVPFGPIYQVDEVLADPHVQALNPVWEAEHPTEGRVRTIHAPILSDGERVHGPMTAPPTLGEHTAEIRAQIAKGKMR